ncbi:MAG: phosphoglycerate kinase [Pirellulales bacterium]
MLTPESMAPWCRTLFAAAGPGAKLSLDDYLAAIPRLDSLSDVPAGTAVLVRGDLDAKPGAAIGDGDVRLRSMIDTLQFGRRQGWKQIVFGHVGRKPEGSLKAVATRLGELLGLDIPLVPDWLDEPSLALGGDALKQVAAMQPGSLLMLENTRRYKIERVLWDATADDCGKLAPQLARIANEMSRLARVYVNEALSAGSPDVSTSIVPAAMDRVALGKYVAAEFEGPMRRCLAARLVVFSGLKADKLDDLEAMIARGSIGWVLTAGSLAMALKKADAQLGGGDFCIGVAEDPAHSDKPYYVAPERIEQARRMLAEGRAKGIRFILPVDFVLADGRVSQRIGPQDQQLDVGPKTSELFEQNVGEFIAEARAESDGRAAAFYNGVFGKFEDSRFEEGTRRFISQLKRMTEAGIEVYVGGGEGGAALEKYGRPEWVTHCFTAGGTVLAVLGGNPVPYLQALWLAGRP